MNAEFFGLLSGGLVVASIIPYSLRVYQGKIHPNLTSWSLWSLIGLALLLTYKSSGAEANIWPAVFGFFNPMLVTFLIVARQRGRLKKPNKVEVACLAIGLISLGMWALVHESKELSQYALYLAIAADACAAIPTVVFLSKQPDEDRPFAWSLFAIAYGLAIFAITEPTFANYILPIYMFLMALTIAFPMVSYRWKRNIPLREWI